MINKEDFQWLMEEQVRELITKNIDKNPVELALTLKHPKAALICSQIKYLQRAKEKLPTLYAARCIIPSISFEQCSSEATAATKQLSGELCIDLTCGLCIDSMVLARSFERVISVEISEELAEIVRYNLSLMGVENMHVVNDSAENFVASYRGAKADVIYVDPDRRGERNKKLVVLEECTPNVVELMPRLLQIGRRVVIKASPMFDVDQAWKLFGDRCLGVEVVSLNNECKEVVITVGDPAEQADSIKQQNSEAYTGSADCTSAVKQNDISEAKKVMATMIRREGIERFSGSQGRPTTRHNRFDTTYRYLLIPDVALSKSRLTRQYMAQYSDDVYLESEIGFALSNTKSDQFCGQIFEIEHFEPYQPKVLKKLFQRADLKRINILKREFPQSTEQIKKALGINEGGNSYAAFTVMDSKMYCILLKNR